MEDPKSDSKNLIDIRFFRQSKGIPEREEHAAELIEGVGTEIVSLLVDHLGRIGRSDLVPRALAFAINQMAELTGNAKSGISNRIANNTVDFVVAMDMGPRVHSLLTLHAFLEQERFCCNHPTQYLVDIPNYGADLIDTGTVVSQADFQAFAFSSHERTYLVCMDKNDGVIDLHLRECADRTTGTPALLTDCQLFNSKKKLVKAGYLGHMSYDGEPSLASKDRGYICSVWMDADVAGGWVSTKAYVRHDALEYIRFVLDELVRITSATPDPQGRLTP